MNTKTSKMKTKSNALTSESRMTRTEKRTVKRAITLKTRDTRPTLMSRSSRYVNALKNMEWFGEKLSTSLGRTRSETRRFESKKTRIVIMRIQRWYHFIQMWREQTRR